MATAAAVPLKERALVEQHSAPRVMPKAVRPREHCAFEVQALPVALALLFAFVADIAYEQVKVVLLFTLA